MTEDPIFRANDARALLENKLFKDAFVAVNEYLDARALSCDPDNKETAQRIILSKQLLAAIRREIERCIQDGDIAQVRIAQLERKTIKSIFKR